MLIIKTVSGLRWWIRQEREKKHSVGFVPTMGALHQGHISLIKTSRLTNDITVSSIFVNPAQFNDPKDLANYPRTYDEDVRMLAEAGTDILFYPDEKEIYPPDFKPIVVDLQGLDLVMEGQHRPGHFNGVVNVVYRLLDIVKPDRLYMGQKDFQQFTVISQMIQVLNLPVRLIVCPIVREKNGLAMSSRNKRLSPEGRQRAALIYEVLINGKQRIPIYTPGEIESYCLELLHAPGFKPEYFSIVDSLTLNPVTSWHQSSRPVACVAVWLEGIRLIDNEYYDQSA